ncbi:hypothetical protein DPMN_050276 [Dreissena polymorpha]|uniref:Uncharacterized protein n=1 Tax=Dreissena polymorpha TaxID=45954 RepID=A0A9D4CFT9_DREPO|nr:hypothetical protein DPMN_050276 [Dreissena polymorpha]
MHVICHCVCRQVSQQGEGRGCVWYPPGGGGSVYSGCGSVLGQQGRLLHLPVTPTAAAGLVTC